LSNVNSSKPNLPQHSIIDAVAKTESPAPDTFIGFIKDCF